MINKNSKIFVAGHNGLVGSAIVRKLKKKGYNNIITINKSKLDLTNQNKVYNFLKKKSQSLSLLLLQKWEVYILITNTEQNLFIVTYRYKIILFIQLTNVILKI